MTPCSKAASGPPGIAAIASAAPPPVTEGGELAKALAAIDAQSRCAGGGIGRDFRGTLT